MSKSNDVFEKVELSEVESDKRWASVSTWCRNIMYPRLTRRNTCARGRLPPSQARLPPGSAARSHAGATTGAGARAGGTARRRLAHRCVRVQEPCVAAPRVENDLLGLCRCSHADRGKVPAVRDVVAEGFRVRVGTSADAARRGRSVRPCNSHVDDSGRIGGRRRCRHRRRGAEPDEGCYLVASHCCECDVVYIYCIVYVSQVRMSSSPSMVPVIQWGGRLTSSTVVNRVTINNGQSSNKGTGN